MWTEKYFRPFVTFTGYAALTLAGLYLADTWFLLSSIISGTKHGASTQSLLQLALPGLTMVVIGMQQIIIARVVFVGIPKEKRSEAELVLGDKDTTDT